LVGSTARQDNIFGVAKTPLLMKRGKVIGWHEDTRTGIDFLMFLSGTILKKYDILSSADHNVISENTLISNKQSRIFQVFGNVPSCDCSEPAIWV
jgi:hypothetical protein